MIKRNDVILAGAIILIAIAAVIGFYVTKSDGSKVVITVDGEKYKTLDLNKDTIVNIDENGQQNIVEIKAGKVTMTEASCPDKLCVKHKSIEYNHETIVCLPHKVVLEIIDGEESDVDMTAN